MASQLTRKWEIVAVRPTTNADWLSQGCHQIDASAQDSDDRSRCEEIVDKLLVDTRYLLEQQNSPPYSVLLASFSMSISTLSVHSISSCRHPKPQLVECSCLLDLHRISCLVQARCTVPSSRPQARLPVVGITRSLTNTPPTLPATKFGSMSL